MNDQPTTPPPELIHQWWEEADKQLSPYYDYIATQAARWGYEQRGADIETKLQKARDEEREACCKWVAWVLRCKGLPFQWSDVLRDARRPKPLCAELMRIEDAITKGHRSIEMADAWQEVQAAIERLQELEALHD